MPNTSPELQERRVLVIEDNLELAEIFADVLSDSGFVVDIIHDGQDALDWLDDEHGMLPDIITLDMHLPRDWICTCRVSPAIRSSNISVRLGAWQT